MTAASYCCCAAGALPAPAAAALDRPASKQASNPFHSRCPASLSGYTSVCSKTRLQNKHMVLLQTHRNEQNGKQTLQPPACRAVPYLTHVWATQQQQRSPFTLTWACQLPTAWHARKAHLDRPSAEVGLGLPGGLLPFKPARLQRCIQLWPRKHLHREQQHKHTHAWHRAAPMQTAAAWSMHGRGQQSVGCWLVVVL